MGLNWGKGICLGRFQGGRVQKEKSLSKGKGRVSARPGLGGCKKARATGETSS
jgi:hypothetical protein